MACVRNWIDCLELRRFLNASPIFPAQRFDVGRSAYSIVTADFNGDGRLDLATPGPARLSPSVPPAVSILLNTGRGTFAAATPAYIGGVGPSHATTGDFNRDGKVDLVTANHGTSSNPGNSLSLLLGRGDGTFEPVIGICPGSNPFTVNAADFDGDGDDDLVTAESAGRWLYHACNGDGTFAAASLISTNGRNSGYFCIGDFDGDGNADLAAPGTTQAGNFGDGMIALGNGTGRFTVRAFAERGTRAPVAVDLNDDGRDDLAFMESDALYTRVSNGDGTFASASVSSLDLGGFNAEAIAPGDFDGDGRQDIAVSRSYGQALGVVPGFGDGKLGRIVNYSIGETNYSWGVVVGDWDGDGDLDLATANLQGHAGPGSVSIVLNAGNGTFTTSVRRGLGLPDAATQNAMALADFNEDGTADLTSAMSLFGKVGLELSAGRPTALTVAVSIGTQTSSAIAVAADDFNGDGHDDIAVITTALVVVYGTGTGTFSAPTTFPLTTVPKQLISADLNNDGRADLVTVSSTNAVTAFIQSAAAVTFAVHPLSALAATATALAAADLNGDGRTDLVAGLTGQAVAIAYGHAELMLAPWHSMPLPGNPIALATGDFNRDGVTDLATAHRTVNGYSILFGRPGMDGPTPFATAALDGPPVSIAAGDVDGDGRDDLLINLDDYYSELTVSLGGGDGTFGRVTRYGLEADIRSLLLADVNDDRRLDVLIGARLRSSLLLNQLGVDTQTPLVPAASLRLSNSPQVAFDASEPIASASVTVDDLVVIAAYGGASYTPTAVSLSLNGTRITFTLPINLPDGDYRIALRAGSVTDVAGNPLAQAVGLDAAQSFFLAGDANRDRKVDFDDLLIVAQNYGQAGKTFSQGNFNYSSDGKVDFDDLLLLAQRYGTSLVTAAPAAATASASRSGPRKRASAGDVLA